MSDYSVIADVSRIMVSKLQRVLVPDLISGNDKIDVCSPAEHNDISLGLFLYDIMESEEIRRSTMMVSGMSNKMVYPPIYLNLYYMLTPYFMGNVKYRSIGEQEALGKIIQYFHDYPIITYDELNSTDDGGTDLRIELLRLDMEQKQRIWTFPNEPYRTSLFYKISPVVIHSSRYRNITRVSDARINVNSVEGNGG